jgi:hypothetical protein
MYRVLHYKFIKIKIHNFTLYFDKRHINFWIFNATVNSSLSGVVNKYTIYNECCTVTVSAPAWSTVFNAGNAVARISTHEALQISYSNIRLIGKLRTVNHNFALPYSTPFSIELKKSCVVV